MNEMTVGEFKSHFPELLELVAWRKSQDSVWESKKTYCDACTE